jgi:hypothetical protein
MNSPFLFKRKAVDYRQEQTDPLRYCAAWCCCAAEKLSRAGTTRPCWPTMQISPVESLTGLRSLGIESCHCTNCVASCGNTSCERALLAIAASAIKAPTMNRPAHNLPHLTWDKVKGSTAVTRVISDGLLAQQTSASVQQRETVACGSSQGSCAFQVSRSAKAAPRCGKPPLVLCFVTY